MFLSLISFSPYRLCQWAIFGVITTVSLAVTIPPAIFAWVVRRDNQLICEIDVLSTLDRANAYQNRDQVSTVSVFYLAYSAILPYWLPLMVRELKSSTVVHRFINYGSFALRKFDLVETPDLMEIFAVTTFSTG